MAIDQIKEFSRQLKNIGPKLAEKLISVGIDSPDKLREIGAEKAFAKMYPAGDAYGDYNSAYLYALEGAIQDCDWSSIPEDIKLKYKKYANSLQRNKNSID